MMASAQDKEQEAHVVVPKDIKTRLKESYDVIAPAYNDWTLQHSSRRIEYLDKLLAKLLAAKLASPEEAAAAANGAHNIHVLELGCGCGLPVSKELLAADPRLVLAANDLSSTQIDLAKQNLASHADAGRVSFVEGDMMGLEFAEASFDAVVALYSLVHLPRDEQVEMVRRVARWLKPGGLALLNFSGDSHVGLVMDKWLHEKGWMYWSGWGSEATAAMVKETGLELLLADHVKDDVDAAFLWVLAKKE